MKLSNFTLEEVLALLRMLQYAPVNTDKHAINAREKLRHVRNAVNKLVYSK